MADRYCRNCGNELGTEDRFCANCGRAVHETAHVPKPEADRPVPPPPTPQQAGASSSGRLMTLAICTHATDGMQDAAVAALESAFG